MQEQADRPDVRNLGREPDGVFGVRHAGKIGTSVSRLKPGMQARLVQV